jgi:predicted Rossmann fold flavoprotein
MEQDSGAIVVVGAGAAGTMAAIFAAQGRRKVHLLEATREGGRKILISGGGRCNVLPQALEPSRFVTASSSNTMRAMLMDWPLAEQRRFFEEDLGIPLALEPESGKIFPVSNRAKDVRDRLLACARERGVESRFGVKVVGLEPLREAGRWRLSLLGGESIEAAAVVLATGGLSIPTTGSDGAGLRIAGALGHRIHPTYPALTPLTCDPPRHAHLSGVSLKVTLEASTPAGRVTSEGGFLFTHQGYSGPAVLDLSHVAVLSRMKGGAAQAIHVRWGSLGEREWDDLLRTGTGRVDSILRTRVPERLAATLLGEASLEGSRSLSQLRRPERRRLVEHLARYRLPWTGEEGYRKVEVTGGGVALEELQRTTLESRRHPGLFLCGEMLDAFGPIGGHNFAWAWATGRAAGRGAARTADARMRER